MFIQRRHISHPNCLLAKIFVLCLHSNTQSRMTNTNYQLLLFQFHTHSRINVCIFICCNLTSELCLKISFIQFFMFSLYFRFCLHNRGTRHTLHYNKYFQRLLRHCFCYDDKCKKVFRATVAAFLWSLPVWYAERFGWFTPEVAVVWKIMKKRRLRMKKL